MSPGSWCKTCTPSGLTGSFSTRSTSRPWSHEVWSGETTFLSRGGQEIPTSQVVVAHKDASGKVEFFSTIARNITASQQAAQALQEANSRLRTLVQASPLAIIAVDLKGRVTSWNPAAERMFGWSQAEVIGQPLPTIPPGQEEASQTLDRKTLEGATLLGLELRRQRRDGSLIDIRLSTASLHDGAGAMTGVMGIIEDITEPRRMAETLRQASRALKAITECHQALIRATDEMELLNRGVPDYCGGGWLSHGLGGLCRGRRPQIGAPGGPNRVR